MEGDFQLGSYLVSAKLNRIELNGRVVRLEPKVMHVLVCLADHHGELVSKEQLIRTVWADTFVTDEVLTRCISELRRIFDDDPKHPRFIETIPKSGYRLISPIQPTKPRTQHATAPRRWRTALVVLAGVLLLSLVVGLDVHGGRKQLLKLLAGLHLVRDTPAVNSIAVLPLENLSGDPSQEYFADGMTDELITNLAKIESLRVISRTSVMQYKAAHKPLREIARALNVNLIVEGAVSRSGDRVRITAQLVDGGSDVQLWAQDFDRDLHDVLSLQSDIAQAIAREIRVKLTNADTARLAAGRLVNLNAHDAYLKGRYQWSKKTGRALDESIVLYHQAIAADPKYALAYAGMADSYIVLENDGRLSATAANPIIKAAATKAVEADPNLADAHMVLAQVKETEWDWTGAEREYRRTIELNPGLARAHHWYALFLIEVDRPNEAIFEIERAVDLEPLTEDLYLVESRIYYLARQYDRAQRPLRMLEELGNDSTAVHELSGFVYLGKRMYQEAISEFLISSGAEPGEPEEWALLTYAYARGGKRKEALDAFARLNQLGQRRFVGPWWMSVAWTGLGDNNRAMYFLNEAYRIQSSALPSLQADPVFDPLRSDPRFQDLLHRLALPAINPQ